MKTPESEWASLSKTVFPWKLRHATWESPPSDDEQINHGSIANGWP